MGIGGIFSVLSRVSVANTELIKSIILNRIYSM